MDEKCKAYLREFSRKYSVPASHFRFLAKLHESGFRPQVIYDVGSNVLHWAKVAKHIWAEARIICFDGVPEVRFLHDERGFEFHSAILSDSVKNVKWYQKDDSPGGSSYYKEAGAFYQINEFVERSTITLDALVRQENLPPPDLIKLDVQGSEMDILRGAPLTLEHCQRLIVEMQRIQYNDGAPLVTETRPYIESLGFRCDVPLFSDNGPDGDYSFVRAEPRAGAPSGRNSPQ